MENKPIRLNGHLIFGCILVIIGILIALKNFHVMDTRLSRLIWPLFFMGIGLTIFFQSTSMSGRVTGGLLSLIGILILLRALDLIVFSFAHIWPMILIGIGLVIILKAFDPLHKHFGRWFASMDNDPSVNLLALFAGFHRQSASPNFTGGNLTAILGGIELDLRQARIQQEAVIHVFALMGGIEIKVPPEWVVSIEGSAILGGYEDKTRPVNPDSPQRLIIRGSAVLGGVSVKTRWPDSPTG